MTLNYDKELVNQVKTLYPNDCLEVDILPKPFRGTKPIKGIVLGADPTYLKDNGKFVFVFGLEKENSPFFRGILKNLNQVGLSLENIYVQNLIKNYFKRETSKNAIWGECASLWLNNLKDELDSQFHRDIPLFVTADRILRVVIFQEYLNGLNAKMIYSQKIIFNPDQNYFGRNVIALFRHYEYDLKRWPEYITCIKDLLPG